MLSATTFLAVAVAYSHAGYFADCNRTLILWCLAGYASAVAVRRAAGGLRPYLGLAAALAGFGWLAAVGVESGRVLATGWFCWLAAQAVAFDRGDVRRVAGATGIFVAAATLLDEVAFTPHGPCWGLTAAASRALSQHLAEARMNPTPAGLAVGVLAFSLAVALAASQKPHRWGRLVPAAAGLIVLQALLVLVAGAWVDPGHWKTGLGPSERLNDNLPMFNDSAWAAFSLYDAVGLYAAAAGLWVAGLLSGGAAPAPEARSRGSGWFAVVTGGLLLAGAWGERPTDPLPLPAGLEVGVYCEWDRTAPSHQPNRPPGLINEGMYGLWLEDFARRGCAVTHLAPAPRPGEPAPPVQRIDPRRVAGKRVVFVLVRTAPYDADELAALNDYMRSGGVVVLVGDHTDLERHQKPFNALAAPHGIELRFDSAYSHVPFWADNIAAAPALSFRPKCWLDFGWGTGGSLALSGAAAPLLTSRYSFSDLGNVLKSSRKEAFLGDYQYQRGEELGDQVLAAAAPVGRGRLVALADSSALQNLLYPRSGRFVRHLVAWSIAPAPGDRRLVFPAVFLAAAACAFASVRRAGWVGVAVAAAWAAGSSSGPRPPEEPAAPPRGPRAAFVDARGSLINRDPFREGSYLALPIRFSRDGYAVEWFYDPRAAADAGPEVIVVPAAARVAAPDRERLHEYLSAGGTLVVTAGRETAAATAALLGRYGVAVGDEPLGGDIHDPEDGMSPRFVCAWALTASDPGARVLYSRLDRPVVVATPVGGGWLVVVGDVHFFRDGNLEVEKGGCVTNTRFLSLLLARIRAGEFRPITDTELARAANAGAAADGGAK